MGSSPPTRPRLGYLDWTRGLCVLFMLHTHAFYAWVSEEARKDEVFQKTVLVGGYPGAAFLFVSGLVLALALESRARRGEPSRARIREGAKRGLEVLGYAFLFRLWMLATSHFWRPRDFLRVDVLNCIGGSLLLAGLVVFGWRTVRGRLVAAAGLAATLSLLAPLTWDGPWLAFLPNPILGYFSGRAPDAFFPLLPWGGFTAAGAFFGILVDKARRAEREGWLFAASAAGGASLCALGLLIDRFGPRIYPREDFWYTSPSYFLFKLGVVLCLLGLAFVADRLPGPSALRQMGRTSLLIYWIHLEIIYGQYVIPGWRGTLGIQEALLGVAMLALAMLGLSVLRTHGPSWWAQRRQARLVSPA